ncbi:hypothetical protein FSP39_012313 [Pinctada imbricata]|uniref:Nucleotide-diphospho-sugar transferase domain-containing protein n=1 Tax=Pinctada imbricata TaxID=66713 RepID=A0AA89BLX9_PINIB|nr:hypothetical protein FSP39_012313 [Pinctada imbricata]
MSRGLENPFVMMTLLNKAFLPFALSWLCNTKYMDVHKHVLFLTTDTQTDAMLRHHWPDVTSVVLHGVDSKRNESYSQVGYVKLMVKRTIAILSILEANTAVFLFEVDCLWKRNPLPFLQSQNLVDIVATKVSKEEFVVAGGFLYLFPTNSTKQLWGALTKRLLVLFDKIRFLSPETSVSEGDNDQQYLSILIGKNYVGIRYKLLFDEEFPDGSWYNLTLAERSAMNPYIINNNWLVGNYEKIERAQRWRHWFIRKDFTCDEQNIALNFQNLNSVDSIL